MTRTDKQAFDTDAIYQKWNTPKASADAAAQAAVEETDPSDDDEPAGEDFLTGDPAGPLDATAIYNKWNAGGTNQRPSGERGHENQA